LTTVDKLHKNRDITTRNLPHRLLRHTTKSLNLPCLASYCYAFVIKHEAISNNGYNSVSLLCLTQTLYKSRAFAPNYVTVPVVCLAVYYFSYLLSMAIFEKNIFVTKYVYRFYLHVLLETFIILGKFSPIYLSLNMLIDFICMFYSKLPSF
jgi:hypothetical protein